MFRQRTSTQKPGDEFLANFRQQFPEAAVGASSAQAQPAHTTTTDNAAVAAPALERYLPTTPWC
ncbi:hypothetical protein BN1723_007918 [Verticillium longisporum]|uniref:Uncharacterized protein n=1 Tax=Verticillium longisporum TaxID=100787 RepID=A0A0G4NP32_VERLO|nr:hypothetical protein BN1723_007918 [Verticillium longisporum]